MRFIWNLQQLLARNIEICSAVHIRMLHKNFYLHQLCNVLIYVCLFGLSQGLNENC